MVLEMLFIFLTGIFPSFEARLYETEDRLKAEKPKVYRRLCITGKIIDAVILLLIIFLVVPLAFGVSVVAACL